MSPGESTNKNYISLRAFGRIHGLSLRAVQKAIATERITDVRRDGTGRLLGVHADNAWAEYHRNTDPVEAAKSGKVILVSAIAVREAARRWDQLLKEQLIALARGVAPQLASEADPVRIERELIHEIKRVLRDMPQRLIDQKDTRDE